MADKLLKFPVLTLVSIFISVSALDQLDKIDVQRLLQRIDKLEENGEAQKAEITLLREKLSSVEQRESALINELKSLKSLLNDESFTTQSVSHERNRRGLVETEVAFYATMTTFDVTHLGMNQNIVFNRAVNNLGNAYSPHHGVFTAPVAGTYVFHVTLACESVHNVDKHFHAKIDVNGTEAASFIVTPGDQSSQMLVLNLAASEEVSVKNAVLDDSVFGMKWSTFTGFLLYENSLDAVSVIG